MTLPPLSSTRLCRRCLPVVFTYRKERLHTLEHATNQCNTRA
ncbi:hypothetical protein [Nocardia xishanensis]|nr:hypothetical protein [Nocardia xishanensis]